MVEKRKAKMAHVNEYVPIHYVGRHTPVRVNTGTETLVEQCHEETTNINKIIARYRVSGRMPEHREGQYLDVSEIGDFTEVREQMNAAMEAYENLPKNITDQFSDVGEFIEYAERQRVAAAQLDGNPGDPARNSKPMESPEASNPPTTHTPSKPEATTGSPEG